MPVIGFIAHVDTSPEMSGAGVKPIVHRHYDGRDLVLPDDPDGGAAAWPTVPYLGECIGHDIVTASGTTLLGADNKSGVAEIMTAAEYLIGPSGDSARADPHRLHAGRRGRARHQALRRRSGSARVTPTRWTAARAANSSSRASRPTR